MVYFWHQAFLDSCLGQIIGQANSTVFSRVAKAAGKEKQIMELLSSWGTSGPLMTHLSAYTTLWRRRRKNMHCGQKSVYKVIWLWFKNPPNYQNTWSVTKLQKGNVASELQNIVVFLTGLWRLCIGLACKSPRKQHLEWRRLFILLWAVERFLFDAEFQADSSHPGMTKIEIVED